MDFFVDKPKRWCYHIYNFIVNRRSGSKNDHAFTESPGRWEPDRKQVVKWAAEGVGNGSAKYPRRVGIRQLPGACWGFAKGAASLQIKVAPRIVYSSLTDQRGLSGTFFFYQEDRLCC